MNQLQSMYYTRRCGVILWEAEKGFGSYFCLGRLVCFVGCDGRDGSADGGGGSCGYGGDNKVTIK